MTFVFENASQGGMDEYQGGDGGTLDCDRPSTRLLDINRLFGQVYLDTCFPKGGFCFQLEFVGCHHIPFFDIGIFGRDRHLGR